MANKSGNAYALTLLCPILPGVSKDHRDPDLASQSHAAHLRDHLEKFGLHEESPLARVPNTYMARFFVLSDVFYEGKPAVYEQLKSHYLVFSSDFHGELEPYLEGMWKAMNEEEEEVQERRARLRALWSHCIGFESVTDAASFVEYIKACQVTTTFFFMGSTDESQSQQLKALYLKQEFSKFVFANQGKSPVELQTAFQKFVAEARPSDLNGPTWRPGVSKLSEIP